jgi:hypothetical protein
MSILEIQFPEDFEARYEKYKAGLVGSSKSSPETTANSFGSELIVSPQENRPFCFVEGKWGFLKFNKYGEKIQIGHSSSRHFRLLQCLLEPFGTAKSVEGVYEAMKLDKDKKDAVLSGYDAYKKKGRQISIIRNSGIKELQKGNKLRGKLEVELDGVNNQVWIKFTS